MTYQHSKFPSHSIHYDNSSSQADLNENPSTPRLQCRLRLARPLIIIFCITSLCSVETHTYHRPQTISLFIAIERYFVITLRTPLYNILRFLPAYLSDISHRHTFSLSASISSSHFHLNLGFPKEILISHP